MRQTPGAMIDLPAQNAAPNDGDNVGADMTSFTGAGKVWKYNAWYKIVGGTSCDVQLWVRRATDDVWAQVVQGGSPAALATGITPGSYVSPVENLGVFDRVLLVRANDTGNCAISGGKLEEYIENNFMRGD